MNILVDLHHEDLFYSLQLLFEKRLGYKVYRPIGLEWYHEGYWAVHPSINTANQYLSTDGRPPLSANGIPVTEEHGEGAWINKNAIGESGIYHIPDRQHANPMHHRGVTLSAFKDMKFDVLVASMPVHLGKFKTLRSKYQKHAKVIFQAGNNWGAVGAENLLTSSKMTHSSVGGNTVFYHQEFDLSVFKPGPCRNSKSIMNLQHLAGSVGTLKKVMDYLPGWEIRLHGAGLPDGALPGVQIPQAIRDVGFVWHVKANEGYGYNIHHSFASGRPMLVNVHKNRGMTAEDLYTSSTVIDVHRKTPQQIASELLIAEGKHEEYCEAVYKRFTEVVNFDQEEIEIRKFMERLQ